MVDQEFHLGLLKLLCALELLGPHQKLSVRLINRFVYDHVLILVEELLEAILKHNDF